MFAVSCLNIAGNGSALGDLADKTCLKFRFITELSDTKPTLN
jgi:hypothetical protein